MGDSEVLIKIAADVGDAVAAMQAMVAQVAAMVEAMTAVGDQSGKTGDDVADMHKKMSDGAAESVASGMQLSKAYDVIKESVGEAIKSLPGLISGAAETGDKFFTLSNRLGVSIESLAELDYIAKQSGASMEGMARQIQGMGGILGNESGKGAKAIEGLGLSIEELKAEKPEEAFFKIIEAIKEGVPASEQNAKAMEIFGGRFRSSTMVIKEDITALRARFHDLGGGATTDLGELGDANSDLWNDVHLKTERFKDDIGASVLPSLNKLIDQFTALPAPVLLVGEGVADLGKKFISFSENMIASKGWDYYVEQLGKVGTELVKRKDQILNFAEESADAISGMAKRAADVNWADVWKGLGEMFTSMGGKLKEFGGSLMEMPGKVIPGLLSLSTTIWSQVVTAFGAMQTAVTAMMGPWGLLAIAVVALLAALWELAGGWDGIKKSMQGVIQFFEDLWIVIKHLTVDGIQALVTWFTNLRGEFKSAADGTGPLATAVKLVTAIFEKWVGVIKTLTAWIPGLFKILGKAVGDQADAYRALDKAQQDQQKTEDSGPKNQKPVISAMEAQAATVAKVEESYKRLTGALGEQIKAFIAGGQSSKQIAESLKHDFGGSAEVWQAAVDKFKKSTEDLKKAADQSPLGKLHKDTKELAKALDDATASGAPMAQTIETVGKKASELVLAASRLPGELDKTPQSIKDIAAAWEAADLAKKIDPIDKAVRDMGLAFKTSTEAGARAAVDATAAMEEELLGMTLSGVDARIHAIDKEEAAKQRSIQGQLDAAEAARLAEITKIQDQYEKEVAAMTAADKTGKGLSDEQRARVDADAKAAIDAVNKETDGKKAALVKQQEGISKLSAFKRGLETGDTDNVEANMRALGMLSKTEADKIVATEKSKLDRMKALNSGFNQTEVAAQEAKLRAAEQNASEQERYLKSIGVTSATVAQEQIRIEKDKLAALEKLDDPYYAAEIQAAKDRIAKMELESSAFQKEAHARGLTTKEEYDQRLATSESTLAFMKGHEDEFTAAAIKAQEDIVQKAAEAAGQFRQTWGQALGSMSGSFSAMGKSIGGTMGGALSGVGGTMSVMQQTMADTVKNGGSMGNISMMMNKNANGMQKASAGVAAAASVIQGVTSVMDATNKRTAGQRALGGAMAGAQAGAAFGPYGMAIGAAAGLVVGLVRGKPAWAKATDEISRDFGAQVSDELGKAIADDAKKKYGGDRMTASIAHIGDIIKEAGGITDKNAEQMTARLRDTFSLVADGKLKADEGRKILDENFGAFADHILSSNKIASKSFQEIIQLNQSSGIKSGEVVKFVTDQTARLGDNLAGMMKPLASSIDQYVSLKDQIANETDVKKLAELQQQFAEVQTKVQGSGEEMNRFERLTVAGFNASIKSGVGYLDAIDALGPALDTIRAAHEAMGTAAGPAIDELLRFREVTAQNPALVESAASLNEVTLALSNIGALNVDTLKDMEAQGLQTFDQLTAAGFTEGQSLQQMKGFLEGVRDAHEQLGEPIDENTQKMLDQAEANGVLSKKQMSTNDIMMQGLTAVIDALGGKVPAAFKTMADSAVDTAGTVKKAIGTDSVKSVDDLTKKVDAVPFDEMATASLKASKDVQTNMAAGAKAVGGVQDQLNRTDWSGWAKAGVNAAGAAKEAVDALSYGHSPGGIKDVPLLLAESTKSAADFARRAATDMLRVKQAVDDIPAPDLVGQMDLSGMNQQAALNARNQMMNQQQRQMAEAAAAAQQGGDTVNYTFDIKAFDAAGVQQAVEQQILPQMLDTLRRGRQLTALRELVQSRQ